MPTIKNSDNIPSHIAIIIEGGRLRQGGWRSSSEMIATVMEVINNAEG